jgi:hypothetical protein
LRLKYKTCGKRFDTSLRVGLKGKFGRPSPTENPNHRQFYDHKLKPRIHLYAVEMAAYFLFIVPYSSCRSCHRSHRFLAPARRSRVKDRRYRSG